MTEEEAMLWQQLRGGRFNGLHFRRQQIIDGFIVDFYCHRARLVVEVDGDVHELQSDYDRERDRILSARHLRVIRIKNREIRQDLPNVLAHIASEAGFR
jgi:very-short-patch-repair endonuclease